LARGPFGESGPWHFEGQYIGRFHEAGIVFRAMDVMAAETDDAAGVHLAGDEIVALHPILVAVPSPKYVNGYSPSFVSSSFQ
jgi:hypothetical protein